MSRPDYIEALPATCKKIPNYPGYFADEDGTIYSTIRNTIVRRKSQFHKGYFYLNLLDCDGVSRRVSVHRLIAITHVSGFAPELEVRHLDGNSKNNHYLNLAWGTHKQNEQDEIAHGKSGKGAKNSQAVLTERQVSEILDAKGLVSQSKLAQMYGVCQQLISRIHARKIWRHLNEPA